MIWELQVERVPLVWAAVRGLALSLPHAERSPLERVLQLGLYRGRSRRLVRDWYSRGLYRKLYSASLAACSELPTLLSGRKGSHSNSAYLPALSAGWNL